MLVDRQDGEPKALEPISKLERGFWPSESCREFRVGTWPRLMLLQSVHLAAMNLHMLLLHPGHCKQTGVSVAVCQTGRGTGGSGHLQAGHRLPQRGRQEHTRPGDSAKRQRCTEPTRSPRTVRLRQLTYMAIAQGQISKRGVELCHRRCRSSPGSLKCFRVRSAMQAP